MTADKTKKLFKKYLSVFGVGKTHDHSKIYHHWEVVLITFTVFNAVLLGFSIYLFLQINGGGIFLVEQNQEVRASTLDRGALQELLSSLETRDTLFNDRKVNTPNILDPSR
ncbi:MAG: hypothetical protein WD509_02930 [Candidatus Paceibacterota bacterium]